jgi:hypothetical protein
MSLHAQIKSSLSAQIIDGIEPRTKSFKLFDGGGLYLLIKPDGSKYWRMKYSFAGRPTQISFGVYPLVSLETARTKRDEARRLLSNGSNPSDVRKSENAALRIKRAQAVLNARAAEEVRSLRVSTLRNGLLEIWTGSKALTLSEPGARHLRHLLSRFVK